MRVSSLPTRALAVLLVVGGLSAVQTAAPTPAVAADDNCQDPADCEPPLPEPYEHSATLSVSRSAGTVTSDAPTGQAISCGSACSVTDVRTTLSPARPSTGWPTYRLSATGGPSGYAPSWTGCDAVDGTVCVVTNDEVDRTVAATWLDVTDPVVLFSPPAKVGAGASLTAIGTDNSGSVARYHWYVDGVPQAATGSALSVAGLSHGSHVVGVEAQDAAGRRSVRASRTVQVDREGPVVTVAELPRFVAAPPTLTFSATDAAYVGCIGKHSAELDPWYVEPCPSPWTLSDARPDLQDGEYTMFVRATDDVGNRTMVTRVVVLDRLAPDVDVSDGPADGASVSGGATWFRFTASDLHLDAVTCALDGAPVACRAGDPVVLTGLGAGRRSFVVNAVDRAGNRTVVTRSFVVPATGTGGTAGPTGPKQRTRIEAAVRPGKVRAGSRPRLVAAGLPAGATGQVRFTEGKRLLCRAAVRGGKAACRVRKPVAPGRHKVVATYSGSAAHAPSSARLVFRARR